MRRRPRGSGGRPHRMADVAHATEGPMIARRIVLPVFVGLLGLLVASGLVAAHAQYVSSTPVAGSVFPSAPPATSVALSEAVQSGARANRVTDEGGGPVAGPPRQSSLHRPPLAVFLAPRRPPDYT